jgi:glycosyltransferase involved in cell wall biosynthesis
VIVSEGVKIARDIARAGAGLVIPPRANELEAAMAGLLEDPEKRERMGEAALAFARRHDWTSAVLKLEDAYRTMIAA